MSADTETFADFDFGLSAADEQRSRHLHAEAIVIDLCFSGPISYRSFGRDLEAELRMSWATDRDALALTLEAMARPAELAAVGRFDEYRAIWEESGITAGTRPIEIATLDHALRTFGSLRAQCAALDWMREARSPADIDQAKARRQVASIGATQLMAGPGPDLLSALGPAHDLGLRILQLTYNTRTVVGAGCTEPDDPGLSDYGRRVVGAANDLGVVVDTSHCGRRTTLDACKRSERPVIASHIAARELHDHVRAKTDEEIEAIARTGGVIGVVAVPFFLSGDPDASIEAMLDHIDHIARVVGTEFVSIGSDWPFPLPHSLLDEAVGSFAQGSGFADGDIASPTRNLRGFDDYRDFPNITRGLVQRGYDDEQIRGVLGDNALRVFRDTWS